MQYYLDEFTFQFSSRSAARKLFYQQLQQSVTPTPTP